MIACNHLRGPILESLAETEKGCPERLRAHRADHQDYLHHPPIKREKYVLYILSYIKLPTAY